MDFTYESLKKDYENLNISDHHKDILKSTMQELSLINIKDGNDIQCQNIEYRGQWAWIEGKAYQDTHVAGRKSGIEILSVDLQYRSVVLLVKVDNF